MRGLPLHVLRGIAHRDRQPAHLEHCKVVLHVADRGNRMERDIQAPRHRFDERALVKTLWSYVEIIALRAHHRGLPVERLLHRGFATLEQLRIRADADDLARLRDKRREIIGKARTELYGI